jgi:hypothetical protein
MPAPCSTLAIATAIITLAITGCATSPANPQSAASATPAGQNDEMVQALNAQNPFSVLKRGMTAKQVKEHVGAPNTVEPFPNDAGAQSEIWVYIRSVPVAFREVAGGSRVVPYVDPTTGEMKEIQEPIMRNETVFADQRIELLMVEGLFAEWKQRARSVKAITN